MKGVLMFNLVPGIVTLDILLIFYVIQFIFTISKNSEKVSVAIHFIIPAFCVAVFNSVAKCVWLRIAINFSFSSWYSYATVMAV